MKIKNKYLKLENTYCTLPEIMFSENEPERVKAPKLIVFNSGLAKELGLDEEFFRSQDGVDLLSGNGVLEGSTPIAQAYAGHQFGHFTMLGDGRAILLGEYVAKAGERVDIQLKGAGKTPYSRGGDGRAALGPMLREYIISEGMNALGISTTRSLAVTLTGEKVIREKELEGAVLTRIGKSHIRVGTFQFASQWGTLEDVKSLADYTIDRHFKREHYGENKYLYLLNEVVKSQGELIAKWNLVGFIHGVMNTDNMAISGETIDNGPCAFMDSYDVNTVFSSIDVYGRYAYGNQPKMGMWNLARFAEALLPLLHEDREKAIKIAENAIGGFKSIYEGTFYT
ncbi:MAG: protein adenylyltransferase SelO, partial [Clostridium sp.]